MRLLLEPPLADGEELEAHVPLGDDLEGEPVRRPVRVVWADREADGTIAGVEFLDVRASMRVPVERDLSLEAFQGEDTPEGAEPPPSRGAALGSPAPPSVAPLPAPAAPPGGASPGGGALSGPPAPDGPRPPSGPTDVADQPGPAEPPGSALNGAGRKG